MVSFCIIFLFCIYNFRTKSQFHVKWICRNTFVIIIIIIIIIIFIIINNIIKCKEDNFHFVCNYTVTG